MAALLAFAEARGLPRPWYLMAHSMGGCIGLRSLMTGLPFQAAAFSAPMWGILMADWMRPMAKVLSTTSRWFAFDGRYAPSTGPVTYVTSVPFVGNTLTTDAEMWDYMRQQVLAHPELALGGPSLGWLKAAMDECAALAALASPAYPVITALGTQERIVDVRPVHDRMGRWPGGRLEMFGGAEHEVLMERPATREAFLARAVALFEAHR
jgi:lysophospholipase